MSNAFMERCLSALLSARWILKLSLLSITKRMISYILFESSVHPSLPAYSKALEIVKNFRALPDGVDFLPGLKAGDSFYVGHGDASAIGWVGASQPAATKAVDLCAAPRPF